MAFSLSPSVDVREYDLSLTIPNLPSSKTGMVLRADQGPCFKITSITTEKELVDTFGYPTNFNYQDWFQAWNFLQYSQSLYIVRATGAGLGITVENAAISLANGGSGNVFTNKVVESYANFYNSDVAELELESNSYMPAGSRLMFVNRDVTSSQKFAVAVCSDAAHWQLPVANPGGRKYGVTDATAYVGDAVIDLGETTLALGDNLAIDGTSYEIADTTAIYTDDYAPITAVLATQINIGDSTVATDVAHGLVAGNEIWIGGDAYVVFVVGGDFNFTIVGTASAQYLVGENILLNTPVQTNTLYELTPALQTSVAAGQLLVGAALTTSSGLFDESIESGTGVVRAFSNFYEYEPDWAAGQFAVIVFKKNTDGQYEQFDDEAFVVSWNVSGRDSEGRNIYVKEYFFNNSKALYANVDSDVTSPVNTSYSAIMGLEDTTASVYPMTANVYDPDGYDLGDIQYGWDLFNDPESFDINILVAHPLELTEGSYQTCANIAATRKDCVAIIAPYNYTALVGKSASAATTYLLERFGSQTVSQNKIQVVFNSYTAIYGNMKYQYDKFNDVNRWIGIGGDVAGLAAQVDATRDPWWAIAGLDRGKVKNVIKVAFNPNKANRDDLYVNAINPVINIPGEGAGIVFGQKTATARPSAFDRLNVRRLLIVIEKAVATACRYMLFEFNDEFTRARIRGLIEPFLRDVKGRRGIYDFRVVCDSSNNTGEVIDKNGLVIDVYIKPTRVAEFIQVNMKVVRTDANFDEIIGG